MLLGRPIFERQAVDALRDACPHAKIARYPSKTRLFAQGLLADSVYFMASGLVKLTHVNSVGKQIIVGVRREGSLLGAAAAILNQPQPVGAQTLTNCRMITISATSIRSIIRAESVLSRCLHERQAYEANDHLLSLVELASHSVEYRLASLLYQFIFAVDSSKETMRSGVKIPFKQWEMAELLAVTPEHTSRVLNNLQQKGVILRKGKCLFACEPEKLLSFLKSLGRSRKLGPAKAMPSGSDHFSP